MNYITKLIDYAYNGKINVTLIILYIIILFTLSPFFNINWFTVGDFSLVAINYYHAIMIIFLLLLMIVACEIVDISTKIKKIINISTIPLLIITFFGLITFSSTQATFINSFFQAFRDFYIFVLGLFFITNLLVLGFTNFKNKNLNGMWSAYILLIVAAISILIAGIFGIVAAGGNYIGYNSIPVINVNNYINSLNESTTSFIDNVVTSHSHQILPAIMASIVALTALFLKYDQLNNKLKLVINLGMIIAIFGVIAMSYVYYISSFGTYSIPALFTSGIGNMNGLALDDMLTGLIGIGALITIIGLFQSMKNKYNKNIIVLSIFITWIMVVVALVGMGYFIEFHETYFGAGLPGVPPNGGPGYLHDLAFIDAHLMYAFFFAPIISLTLLVFLIFSNRKNNKLIGIFSISGNILSVIGLFVYVETISSLILLSGIILILFSLFLIVYYINKI
jgi:hypothetical protein